MNLSSFSDTTGSTTRKLSMKDFMPIPDGFRQYSDEFIFRNGAIILGYLRKTPGIHELRDSQWTEWTLDADESQRGTVLVGVCEDRLELKSFLRLYHSLYENLIINFISIDIEELELYRSEKKLGLSDFSQFAESPRQHSLGEYGKISTIESQNPIANLLQNILLEAMRLSVQDIHFEQRESEGVIRIVFANKSRIFRRLNLAVFSPILNHIKILARMNVLESEGPQDSSFRYRLGNSLVDIRASSIGTIHGESISLRILRPMVSAMRLGELGYQQSTLRLLRWIIKRETGLLLFCGSTGSGKSTSMNSLLFELNPDSKKIISIEDPVEIQNPYIEQIQVQEDANLGFSEILRRVLRRNPDIILLGEIRDSSTAKLAVSAGLSGHLIMTTLHCSTKDEVYQRLQSLGIERDMLRSTLIGVVTQKLFETSPGRLRVRERIYLSSRVRKHILNYRSTRTNRKEDQPDKPQALVSKADMVPVVVQTDSLNKIIRAKPTLNGSKIIPKGSIHYE